MTYYLMVALMSIVNMETQEIWNTCAKIHDRHANILLSRHVIRCIGVCLAVWVNISLSGRMSRSLGAWRGAYLAVSG